jgi:hypothetical protein
MAEIPKRVKMLLFGKGAMWHACTAMTLDLLGFACLIVGIVGDVINKVPGLEPTNWFLMAIGLWLWGFWAWYASYLAAKEG